MSKNQEPASGKLCERIQAPFLYNSWDEVTPYLSNSNNDESSHGKNKSYDKYNNLDESFRIDMNTMIGGFYKIVQNFGHKFNPRFTQALLSKKTFLKILFIFILGAMFRPVMKD
tara:strand:+ start:121 stop:462 length:342 start_codon:yes stop_codon:yes gene_type:complete